MLMRKRNILLWAALLVVVLLAVNNRDKVEQFWMLLSQVRWWLIPLVFAIQLTGYYCHAKYYQSFLSILGYRIEVKRLLESAMAINFVNAVFPSFGVSGASFLANDLKSEVPVGKSTLTQLMRNILTFLSFMVVLAAGFLLLFFTGGVSKILVRLTLLLLIIIFIVGLLLIVGALDRVIIEKFAVWGVNWLNGTARRLLRRRKHLVTIDQIKVFLDEFYEGMGLFAKHRTRWLVPFLYTLGINLTEVATIQAVFWGFGINVSPGVVVAAYTLAVAASILVFFTGGVGVYEASMVTALVALGLTLTEGLSVVLVYRGLSYALFIPIGFHYYRKKL